MSKVSKSKKSVSNEVAPVVAPEVVTAPEVVAPVEESSKPVEVSTDAQEVNIETLFNKLVSQFQDLQSVVKTLQVNLKVLQKEVVKERKENLKLVEKSVKKSQKKRSPSGFAKPAPISNELANFLGLPEGSELARTDVTSKVIAYVKQHDLQNPEAKTQIVPDAKLKELLGPADGDIIKFFNLQTYLKKHFLPAQPVVAAPVTVV
jgi:chromatin remodeling complex protein RSC6